MTSAGIPRFVAASALVGVLALACGPTPPAPGDPGVASLTATPGVSEGPVPPGGTPTVPEGAPATGAPAPEDAATGVAPPPTEQVARTPADDLGPVGANGRAMLRGDRPGLVIEVDVQEGLRPDRSALDHLVGTLTQHADKPDGIVLAGGNTFASDRTAWTAGDLRDVAAQHRSTATTDDTVSLYVLYVRGGFVTDRGAGDGTDGEETSAVGVAHRASEVALFPERWRGIGDVLGSGTQLERAVLVHELGHVLGLVELTYDSDHPRQDPEHPGHSTNRGSVMYWAVETTLVGQVFNGPPPDRFDADDAADLAALRAGG